jgi:nuclear pore complex protein Nup160
MLNLYVETSAHLEPSTSDSVVTLSIPPANSLQLRSGAPVSRIGKSPVTAYAKNEPTYATRFLASQGSIYFRRAKTYPRTFIWRLLEGNNTLELRCADLARSEHEVDEAYLTIRFEAQDLILPGGVALSDVEEQDVLYIFLITSNKELQTLAVPLDFFRKAEASHVDRRSWCKTFVPSSFTIDTPHRLHAHTPFELFVSLDSGRLQRLTRKAENDGSHWIQDNFDDKSWGASLRGMVKWQSSQSIPYDSRYLSQTTANAMIASSDSTHLYTICLNHTLRVWSLTTGKLVASKDLLDRAIQSQDPHTILSPATPSFLRLFKAGMMDHSILITYSPYNEGQFKFWDVRGGLTEPLSIEDKFPDVILRPPDPDPSGNTIWSLSGFELRPGSIDEPTELWVLWRNNNFGQVYSLHFDLGDLSQAWTTNWVKAQSSISRGADAPDLVKNDTCGVTEKWLEFLFWPNRYPTSVRETSLYIYEEAMHMKPTTSGKDRPLQERLCASIASAVKLRKYSESELDYARFASDTDKEWRNYWRIAEAINAKRRSPISLAFDAYTDMAWVLQSDQCCGIRECNDLELVRYNQSLQHLESITSVRWPHRKGLTEDSLSLQRMAQLLDIASSFSRSFSPELTMDCESALRSELLEEPEHPLPYRINDFYERCCFGDAIPNETYEKVLHGVEAIGGLEIMGAELIPAILSLLPGHFRGSHTALRSTIFGSVIVDAGLDDTITMGRQVVYDLFVLVIFLECEENQDENRSEKFDAPDMFKIMLDILREYEKKMWLLSHVRNVPVEFSELSMDSPVEHKPKSSTSRVESPTQRVTLLRDTKGKDVKPQPAVGSPQSYLLTEMLSDVEVWVGGASEISSDDGCVWIECDLIVHGNIALAGEFSRFQPNTPWSTYVKGRLCLARSEHEQAASYFGKAAYPLGE